MSDFLKMRKTELFVSGNQKIVLKGVNLGGWLMMEGYIMHAPNRAEQLFKKEFQKHLGATALLEFEHAFRENFIQEKDIAFVANYGFNCIRVPFNYRLIEKRPFKFDTQGVLYLDRLVSWAQKYKVWIILDLHAAPGAQNYDWHSDSLGKAELWTNQTNQKRTYAVWEFLADRYKENRWIAGYNVLNESVTEDTRMLNKFYKELIKKIRAIDKNHILFIEGNNWSTDLNCLDVFEDDNTALSIHVYRPSDFTFNFVPHLSYPLFYQNENWNKDSQKKFLEQYAQIAQKRGCHIFVGEFGVNYREGFYGEDKWVDDMAGCFEELGFSWAYWTYKAVKNGIFPDGIFSSSDNPPWVNRQGPKTGWETYHLHWPTKKQEMIHSWDTNRFSKNEKILSVLSHYAKKLL